MTKPLKAVPATLPSATVGQPYPPTLVASVSGGVSPYRFSAKGLPTGIVLSISGVLSGTTFLSGVFSAIVTVADSFKMPQTVSFPLVLVSGGGAPPTETYPDLIYSTPADNPTAPGDTFTPTVSAVPPAGAAPAIATLTESGIPGDTLVAAGDAFNSDIKLVYYGQTTSGNGASIDGIRKRLSTVSSNLLASRLSPSLPANSMYLAWPKNSNGIGYPIAVNKTELWWAGVSRNATYFDQANYGVTQQSLSVIGDTCMIHGRNLSTVATSTTSLTIGTGSQSLSTQTGLNYQPGDNIFINSDSSLLLGRMAGTVTSYNSGSGALVANITSATGSGTGAKWNLCNSWVYFKPVGAAGQFVSPTAVDPYCVEFPIPSGTLPATSNTGYHVITGTGVTFTVAESGLGYVAGMQLLFVTGPTAGTKVTMTATVVSYNSGTKQLVVDITAVNVVSGVTTNVHPWVIWPQCEIWCHNGHGGIRGWGGPLTTRIIAAETYLGTTGTNQVTLGAPTGGDDVSLFNSAISSLGAGGSGTINVPAGTYTLSTRPNAFVSGNSTGIWLKGAGKGLTTINVTSAFNNSLVMAIQRESKITDLTINVDSAATISGAALSASWVENVDIVCHNANCVTGARYLSNCVLTGAQSGSTVVVPGATDVTALGVTFNHQNLCEGSLFATSMQRLHAADCITQNLNVDGDSTQRGVGRMWVGQMSQLQANQYFSRNFIIKMAPSSSFGDQNKGEQFLWDSEAGQQSSLVASATLNTVTYADAKAHGYTYVGTTVFITAGKGITQRAIVIGEFENTLTLDRNWLVIPDTTSRINITFGPAQCVMYANNQSANNNYKSIGLPNSTASQGFETNGGFDIIYRGNTLTNGFQYSWSVFNFGSTEPCTIPSFGFMIEDNTVTKSNNGVRLYDNGSVANSETLTTCGIVHRRNVQTQCIDSELFVANGAAVDMFIWENNSSSDATRGIYQYFQNNSPLVVDLQVYDSTFNLGTGTFAGSKAIANNGTALSVDQQPASGQFVGFQS